MAEPPTNWFRANLTWLKSAFIAAITLAILYLLYRELRGVRPAQVWDSLQAISRLNLLTCLGLTVLNYVVLVGYDWLAVRAISHPLSLSRIAFASFTGFVMSNNVGAVLGGTPVRVRLYSSWGMSAPEIVRLMVMIGSTFWFGAFALAGVVFILDPLPVPLRLRLPFSDVQPLGIGLLVVSLAYLALAIVWTKPLRWHGHEVSLPHYGIVIAQLIVSALDLIIAAGALYVLLPESVTLEYPQFLGVYLLGLIIVILTHIPGGVGIFELVILAYSAATSKPEMVATLIAFRFIYFLLPLAITILMLIGHELGYQRQRLKLRKSKPEGP